MIFKINANSYLLEEMSQFSMQETPYNIIILLLYIISLLCTLNPYKEAPMTPKYDTGIKFFVLHCIVYNVQHSGTLYIQAIFFQPLRMQRALFVF